MLLLRTGLVVTGLLLAFAPAAHAQEPAATAPPVAAREYQSPRDTLHTFLDAMGRVQSSTDADAAWPLIEGTLDMTRGTPPATRRLAAKELFGLFNRLGRIDVQAMAPDAAEVEANAIQEFEFFPGNERPAARALFDQAARRAGAPPPASVRLVMGEDGHWRFSRQTLEENLKPLTFWAESLQNAYGKDVLGEQAFRQWIPRSLRGRFFAGLELWQWVGLGLAIFLAVLADVVGRSLLGPVLKRVMSHYIAHTDDETRAECLRPFGLAIGATTFILLTQPLALIGLAATILSIVGRLVLTFAIAWAAWSVTDLISDSILKRPAGVKRPYDDMLIPLLRKTAKLFIAAMGVIYIADAFNVQLVPLLASFGIAGLAISFAAQDMVKNLFGGLTIFLDHPFRVGERIVYKGFDGTVEEIGFRITRLRTMTGHLVTIPNGGITSEPVENIQRRPYLRRIMNITITYDTPKEKIEQAVQIVRDILKEPGLAEPIHSVLAGTDMPPRVYFNELNADSLNLFVIYWYVPADWWAFQEHGQRLNLRIFEEFAKADIEFAFPTRTLFLAGDPKRKLVVENEGGS